MPKRGPKPKRRSAKRTKLVAVLFSPEEFRTVKEAAGEEAVGPWIRDLILGALDTKVGKPPTSVSELQKQMQEMRRRIDQLAAAVESKKPRA